MNANTLFGSLRHFLEQHVVYENLAGFRIPRSLANPEPADVLVSEICECYVSTTKSNRQLIVDAADSGIVLWFLYKYAIRLCSVIESTKDLQLVRNALVACAIADQRPDTRDALLSLGYIFRACQRAGIRNPMPIFQEVAALADNAGNQSTSLLISKFNETAVCDELKIAPIE